MRARFRFNPDAGRRPQRRRRQFEQLRRGLARAGWTLDAEPAEVIVVCGGDGTLHRVVNEWAEMAEPRPALAVAPPWGTANILAHALGVPGDPGRAAEWLSGARALPLRLGVASITGESGAGERRYFFSVASTGFDAAVVHALSAGAGLRRKRRWGKLAFAVEAVRQWRQPMPDGVLFSLTPFYGGRFLLGELGEDGTLALRLGGRGWHRAAQALGLARGRLAHAPGVERLAEGPVEVAQAGLPVELDGEAAGFTPARFEPAAVALRVLVR